MNLLKETIEKLKDNNKDPKDVLWVGNDEYRCTWEEFSLLANRTYDCGYGGQEVARDIKIVGLGFWLERHEYDGSEWWEFKEVPKKNCQTKKINEIMGGSWSSLKELNDEY